MNHEILTSTLAMTEREKVEGMGRVLEYAFTEGRFDLNDEADCFRIADLLLGAKVALEWEEETTRAAEREKK